MALTGTLSTLSLPNLIQLHCSTQQNAIVRLTHRGRLGMLVFASGELVHASAGGLAGEDAVYELLSWEDGEFHVDDTVTNMPPQNVDTPWSMLLLDMLHRIDEERAERDAGTNQVLQESKQQGQIRGAVVITEGGRIRGSATDGDPERDAALVGLIANRVQALGQALNAGAFERIVCSRQNEKVWVEKLADAYLGCWLNEKVYPDQLKEALAKLKENASKTT